LLSADLPSPGYNKAGRAESKNQQPFGVLMCTQAESLSFAVLSTAKEKYYYLCDLCALSEAGGLFFTHLPT